MDMTMTRENLEPVKIHSRIDPIGGDCLTPCPFECEKTDIEDIYLCTTMVGSWACQQCKDNVESGDRHVVCNHAGRILSIYRRLREGE